MDAIYADILVILDVAYEKKMSEAVELLKSAGMKIESVDEENDVVGGQVELYKVAALEHLPCVDYVRKVFTYDVHFRQDDSRHRAGE